MSNENLWGDLPLAENVETPLSLLRTQAAYLGKMTSGLLEGRIVTTQASEDNMHHEFRIVVPALGHYSTTLLSVLHPLELYPLKMFLGVTSNFAALPPIADEVSFKSRLKEFLQSDRTRRIIQSLVTQAKEMGANLNEDRLAAS